MSTTAPPSAEPEPGPEPEPAPEPSPADPPLRRNRDFAVLVASQAVSAAGDAVSITAMPLLVLALTGSGVAMGVVSAVSTGADFLMAAVAGALADRGDRKRMMFLADLGRTLLTALVPLCVLLGGPTMAVIVLVAAPLAVLRAFFRAGYLAAMPSLVGRSQLARGNGVLETGASAAFILGPAIAGLLVTVIGPGPTLALDAASFGLSALGISMMRREMRAPADRAPSRVVDDIREGFAFVLHHPTLRTLISLFAVSSALLVPITAAMTFRVVRDLGEAPAAFGLTITAIGVGTIVGSMIAARLGPHASVARAMLASVVVIGVSTALCGVIPSLAAVVVLNAVTGAGEAVLVVVYISVRAGYSPDALLGRIGSTSRVMSLGLQPIGSLVGGILIDAIGGSSTLIVIGAGICSIALVYLPVRGLRNATFVPVAPVSATIATAPLAERVEP
jgi:MFS transporter, ENTS family, enterobactin (siderophore) exporter